MRGHDAVVVAAFGDPGLDGPARAAAHAGARHDRGGAGQRPPAGPPLSIVAISQRIQAWYREVVACHGFGRHGQHSRLDRPLSARQRAGRSTATAARTLCERAVREDGAEVIVLAGAPLAGLARALHGQLPVPVVDGVSSAVRHAETLVALQPGKAAMGSFAPPPAKPHRGLPEAIARLLEGNAAR
jgi:allantoin racemase